MDWVTEFYEHDSKDWTESHTFYFGKRNQSELCVIVSYDENSYGERPYQIRSGFEINPEDRDIFSKTFTFDFNQSTIETFNEHYGDTRETWWCAVFEKDDLAESMELTFQLKEYLENYYKEHLEEKVKELVS